MVQSLKDPLRAKGFMGTVTKGDAEVRANAPNASWMTSNSLWIMPGAFRVAEALSDVLMAEQIECHEVCKVITLKDRKGIIDAETLSSLVDVIEVLSLRP